MSLLLAMTLAAAEPPLERQYLRISFHPRRWDESMIRPATPAGAIDSWFRPDGAAFKAMGGLPAGKTAWVSATVAIDADGKVGVCKSEPGLMNYNGPMAEAICADLARHGRFIPVLAGDGRRIPTELGIHAMVTTKSGLWGLGGDNPPLVDAMPAPPAPPLPPTYWLPSFEAGNYRVNGARPFAGDRQLVASGALRWTGVALSVDPAGKTVCVVAKSSGDPRLDQTACKTAGKYRVAAAATMPARYPRAAMVMMVFDKSKPSALLPLRQKGSDALLTPAGAARIAAILGTPISDEALAKRVNASIDANGRVTRCTIAVSDGNDRADAALCRALRDEILFAPAEDVFGLPTSDWL